MKWSKIAAVISIAVFLCLVIPLNHLAFADSLMYTLETYPTPDWAYINRTTTSLSITSTGEATATAQLVGIPGVTTEIWIFMGLERYSGGSWVTVNSWYQIGRASWRERV